MTEVAFGLSNQRAHSPTSSSPLKPNVIGIILAGVHTAINREAQSRVMIEKAAAPISINGRASMLKFDRKSVSRVALEPTWLAIMTAAAAAAAYPANSVLGRLLINLRIVSQTHSCRGFVGGRQGIQRRG